MENQHRKISGYRELNETEIELMNQIKAHGQKTKELYAAIEGYLYRLQRELHDESKHAVTCQMQEFYDADPLGWLNKAKDSGAESIMFAVRSVARPPTF